MTAISKILAGGIGLAALAAAAPAAAQYYPQQSPYGYGQGGYGQGSYGRGGLGAIIESILGRNRNAHGVDQRVLVERCIAAVNNRIERRYGARYRTPYGYGGGYSGANARVVGITNIDPDRRELQVRGIATAGGYAAAPYGGQYGAPYGGQHGGQYGGQYGAPYGQAYGYGQPQGELKFRCDIDYRGRVRDIDIERNRNYTNNRYRGY